MRGNALRRPDARESARAATSRLTLLLCGCTDERLKGFTAGELAATHRVKLPVAAEMLARERARRA